MTRGYADRGGDFHRDGAHQAQLFLEQARRAALRFSLQRVAADELAEVAGAMSGSAAGGPHLMEDDRKPLPRDLQRGLGPRESSADHVDRLCRLSIDHGACESFFS